MLLTLMSAFIVVVIALALLAVGWLLTGKSKIRAGSCGRDPTKDRDRSEHCGTDVSCHLCHKPDEKKK